eukprot:1408242-Rhodomonas_salina.2
MSGTDVAIVLRGCCAVFGTDVAVVLRLCYAMCGTDIGHSRPRCATRGGGRRERKRGGWRRKGGRGGGMRRRERRWLGMDCYLPTRFVCDVRYSLNILCYVPMSLLRDVRLCACYAISITDLAYGATRKRRDHAEQIEIAASIIGILQKELWVSIRATGRKDPKKICPWRVPTTVPLGPKQYTNPETERVPCWDLAWKRGA